MGVLVPSVFCCLLGGVLFLSCNAQPLNGRSCSSVKDTLGFALGSSVGVFDDFIEGNNFQCSLGQTCCSEQMEEVLMQNRSTSHNLDLQLMMYGALDSCFSNSDFETSVEEIVKSEKKKLLNLLFQIYLEYFTPHKTIFDEFYTYLAELPRTLDMCALSDEVNKILFEVYRATIATAAENDLIIRQPAAFQECFYNYFMTTNALQVRSFYYRFEKSFRRFWYFMRSRKIIKDVANWLIIDNALTRNCQESLLQAMDCAKCSGYADIKVCRNLCLNTWRGCLVDFKEVGTSFNTMLTAVKSLQRQMLTQFNPDHSFKSLQSGFINFISETIASHSEELPKIIEQCGPLYQVGAPPITLGKRNVHTSVSIVSLVQQQMQCFDNFNDLFSNVENTMCNGAATGNTDCWNGREAGSYEHEVLNASRIEQQRNPEVSVSGRMPYLYEELRQFLEVGARDVRYLLSEEVCVEDDEDTECIEPDEYCKIPILPVVEVEYSGSGLPPIRPTFPTTDSTDSTDSTVSPTVVVVETDPTKETTTTRPNITDPTIDDTTDNPNTGGSASSVQCSLYMILLLATAAVFLL